MADTVVHVPETAEAVTADPVSVEEFRKAQLAEWGAWKATGPIYVDGVRAFNPGDAVPKSHVTHYGYDKQGLVEPA